MVSGKAFAAKCWKVIEGGTALNLKPHRHAEEEFSSSHARSHQARPKLSINKCSYQCSGHVVNTMSNKLLRQSTSIILSTLLEVVDGPPVPQPFSAWHAAALQYLTQQPKSTQKLLDLTAQTIMQFPVVFGQVLCSPFPKMKTSKHPVRSCPKRKPATHPTSKVFDGLSLLL